MRQHYKWQCSPISQCCHLHLPFPHLYNCYLHVWLLVAASVSFTSLSLRSAKCLCTSLCHQGVLPCTHSLWPLREFVFTTTEEHCANCCFALQLPASWWNADIYYLGIHPVGSQKLLANYRPCAAGLSHNPWSLMAVKQLFIYLCI